MKTEPEVRDAIASFKDSLAVVAKILANEDDISLIDLASAKKRANVLELKIGALEWVVE